MPALNQRIFEQQLGRSTGGPYVVKDMAILSPELLAEFPTIPISGWRWWRVKSVYMRAQNVTAAWRLRVTIRQGQGDGQIVAMVEGGKDFSITTEATAMFAINLPLQTNVAEQCSGPIPEHVIVGLGSIEITDSLSSSVWGADVGPNALSIVIEGERGNVY